LVAAPGGGVETHDAADVARVDIDSHRDGSLGLVELGTLICPSTI
jgi:hypothetical protein